MAKYSVEPTRQALADADEAFMWIYNDAPEAALRWFDGLIDAMQTLERDPKRCAKARESVVFGDDLRQLNYGRYRIIFKISLRTVFVISIRHSARQALSDDDL